MIFNIGTFKHKTGFEVTVDETGKVMTSPKHPFTLTFEEVFNPENWTDVSVEVTEETEEVKGEE